MTKDDIHAHMDGVLALLYMERGDSTEGMSTLSIAKECGVPENTIINIEKMALKKLENDPRIWEAITSPYRKAK